MRPHGNDELHGPVRKAVEDVRAVPPPPAAKARAIERAQKVPVNVRRRPDLLLTARLGLIVAGSAAAVLLVCLLLLQHPHQPLETSVARNEKIARLHDEIQQLTREREQLLHRGELDEKDKERLDDVEKDIRVKKEVAEALANEEKQLADLTLPKANSPDSFEGGYTGRSGAEKSKVERYPGGAAADRPVSGEELRKPATNANPIASSSNGTTASGPVGFGPERPTVPGASPPPPQSAGLRPNLPASPSPYQPIAPTDQLGGERKGDGKAEALNSLQQPQARVTDGEIRERLETLKKNPANVSKEEIKELEARLAPKTPAEIEKQPAEADKGPKVWHRDASQPTVARVYVGDRNSLELVSLQVTVTIDGPRARTLVDHVFRNPHNRQLEGTFEYPLPAGASPSYFAMFLNGSSGQVPPRFARQGRDALPADALAALQPADVVAHVDARDWGQPKVARVVNNDKGREAYEEVVRGRVDPALLEYAGGNTFRGRVFPIPAKGYNRVLIAYEELLPVTGERLLYRYPLPGCQVDDLTFTLQASAAACLKPEFAVKDGKITEKDGHLLCNRTWQADKPTGDVVFSCIPVDPRLQAVSGRVGDGPLHLYARVRPELSTERVAPFARHAVFLLDTSLSEYPDRFAVSLKLLKAILEADKDLESFNILTFNVGAAWVEPKGWLPNTAAGRETAFQRLDGLVLEGATDVGAALEKLVKAGFDIASGTPVSCFLLSDGNVTWGEADASSLVSRFERRCPLNCRFHCYRTGLGAENSELAEALTRRGGGIFQCYGEADVPAAAVAHRHDCLVVRRVRFVGGPAAADVLVAGRKAAVYPNGDLVVAARFAQPGRTTLLVEGQYQGKDYVQEFPVEVGPSSELAPRAWAEVAVASLLALNDPQLEGLVTAYCQQYGIASRTASFLVLENEADYKRFNLEEQSKVLPGDLGGALEALWLTLSKEVTPRAAFSRFLERIEPRVNLLKGEQGAHVRALLALLADEDFVVAGNDLPGALVKPTPEMAHYLKARAADRHAVAPYLAETERRSKAGDVAGAVRVLSSIIEEHTGRSDALRLVGYRLLDLKQAGEAARLFSRVQQQRPFEPHSYRDLARSLEEDGHFALAAVQYEIVLAGTWHARFRDDIKLVAQEEYVHMMQDAIRTKAVGGKLADQFGERLEKLRQPQTGRGDLRVSISWNTDATDVDLWVLEPDGTKCFYSHNKTKNGGQLSQDQTQGYGPERYTIAQAPKGEFVVLVDYFAANPNLLGGETNVQVVVRKYAGTDHEEVKRYTVILKDPKKQVEVCRVKF